MSAATGRARRLSMHDAPRARAGRLAGRGRGPRSAAARDRIRRKEIACPMKTTAILLCSDARGGGLRHDDRRARPPRPLLRAEWRRPRAHGAAAGPVQARLVLSLLHAEPRRRLRRDLLDAHRGHPHQEQRGAGPGPEAQRHLPAGRLGALSARYRDRLELLRRGHRARVSQRVPRSLRATLVHRAPEEERRHRERSRGRGAPAHGGPPRRDLRA